MVSILIQLRDDIVFQHPEDRIREYCEIEIYQGYDDQHTINNTITHDDVIAANRLFAMIDRYDNTESDRLFEHSSYITKYLIQIPNVDLHVMSDKHWLVIRHIIQQLLKEMLSVRGIGLAKATKILHLKRPNVFPVLDSFLLQFLLGLNISEINKRRHVQIALDALDRTRTRMKLQQEAFQQLVENTQDLPIPLTPVRLFDILCWTTEKWDRRKIRKAPYGTPHRSLLPTTEESKIEEVEVETVL